MQSPSLSCTSGAAASGTSSSTSCTSRMTNGSGTSPPPHSRCSTLTTSDRLKASGEQLDDRVVEVHWDKALGAWRMMRFRNDKPNGNHKSVVEAIIKSIADGVEKDQLFARSNAIRNAWKTRQMHLAGQRPPPQASVPPPKPPPPQQQQQQPRPAPAPAVVRQSSLPDAKPRFGPIATSPWSKVSGPAMVNGMYR